MKKRLSLTAMLLLPLLLCQANGPNAERLRYIEQYRDLAISEMKRSGIPASIILAQGIHESGAGLGELATASNNHFGIKCKKDWTGPTYFKEDDDLDADGTLVESCFRAYSSSVESYVDHTDFLLNSERYRPLLAHGMDYRLWARGLERCGYATDPDYAEKLVSLIEAFNLSRYDEKPLQAEVVSDGFDRRPERLVQSEKEWQEQLARWFAGRPGAAGVPLVKDQPEHETAAAAYQEAVAELEATPVRRSAVIRHPVVRAMPPR